MKYAGFIRIFLLKETTKVRSARNYEVKQFDEMNSFSISVGFLLSFFSFFFLVIIVKSEKRILDKPETVEKKDRCSFRSAANETLSMSSSEYRQVQLYLPI